MRRKPANNAFPGTTQELKIHILEGDSQKKNVQEWLGRLRKLKNSLMELRISADEITRPAELIWLTKVMQGDKERLVYLITYVITGGAFRHFGYLLIGKDSGSIYHDPIYVDGLDIRYLFKSEFLERFEYLKKHLKIEPSMVEVYKDTLLRWVDTYKDGEIDTTTQQFHLTEVTTMVSDSDRGKVYKSAKVIKQEHQEQEEQNTQKKTSKHGFINRFPMAITQLATVKEIHDSKIFMPVERYPSPIFDEGYWRSMDEDQVAVLNAISNMFIYPWDPKWASIFTDVHMSKANTRNPQTVITGRKFLFDLYSPTVFQELRDKFTHPYEPERVAMYLAKVFKDYVAKVPFFLNSSNLAPIQIKLEELIEGDHDNKIPVTFVANDYASYVRLSLAFGSGEGKISVNKAFYIRNAFKIPEGKAARIVIMTLFPSSTAMVDHKFLAMCNYDNVVDARLLTLDSISEMAKTKDFGSLKVMFQNIPHGATTYARDPVIARLLEWRSLCIGIAPKEDEGSLGGLMSIKDMLATLVASLLLSAKKKAAAEELPPKKEKTSKPRQPKVKDDKPKTPKTKTEENKVLKPPKTKEEDKPTGFGTNLGGSLASAINEKKQQKQEAPAKPEAPAPAAAKEPEPKPEEPKATQPEPEYEEKFESEVIFLFRTKYDDCPTDVYLFYQTLGTAGQKNDYHLVVANRKYKFQPVKFNNKQGKALLLEAQGWYDKHGKDAELHGRGAIVKGYFGA